VGHTSPLIFLGGSIEGVFGRYRVMTKELNDFIIAQADRQGFTVLEVSFKGRSGLSVEITLDKPDGGITLEECSEFNRTVSSWLDKSDVSAKGFTVDVASPGLDRVLKSDADMSWAVGKRVKINVSPTEDGKNLYEGELKSFGEGKAVICVKDGENVAIEKKNIMKAQPSPDV
jgi:ribosome maturation factor RimP